MIDKARSEPDWKHTLTNLLSAAGFDLLHWFPVQSYNASAESQFRLETFDRTVTTALLIANSKCLWPHFGSALKSNPDLLSAPHPLYTFVQSGIKNATEGADIPVEYQTRWAHAEGEDLIPIQKIADASGFAKQGPVGLNIHKDFGPWFGLRAVIAFDLKFELGDNQTLSFPCDSCHKPCLEPLVRAQAATESLTSEHVEAQWKLWLRVRDACPIGKDKRYDEDQIRYHYTKDIGILKKLASPS